MHPEIISRDQLAQAHYYARRLPENLVDEYIARVAAARRASPRMHHDDFRRMLVKTFHQVAPGQYQALLGAGVPP